MKIDLTRAMVDLNDKVLPKGDGESWTMLSVLCHAVTSPQEGYKPDEKQKFADYEFALKLREAGDSTELSIDEAKHLKECVHRTFSTIIFGQIYSIFESCASGKAVEDALKI